MKLTPMRLPKWLAHGLGYTVIVLTAPVWAPVLAALLFVVTLERWLDPPRWRRVFALWPVECDPWPDHGYSGWVWLETVWRNPASEGWSKYRYEAPSTHPEREV